jgi:hypothetical protein
MPRIARTAAPPRRLLEDDRLVNREYAARTKFSPRLLHILGGADSVLVCLFVPPRAYNKVPELVRFGCRGDDIMDSISKPTSSLL